MRSGLSKRFFLPLILIAQLDSPPGGTHVFAKPGNYGWGYMVPDRMKEYFPNDIAQFLDKRRTCVHWAGEVGGPMDAERLKSLQKGMEGCGQQPTILKRLEAKYAVHPIVADMRKTVEEIDAGESLHYSFIWKDPEKKSKVLNKFINEEAEGVLTNVPLLMKEYDAALRNGADLGFVPYMLFVQWGYLQEVLREDVRLKPAARAKIQALSKDSVFLGRVADYRRTLEGKNPN